MLETTPQGVIAGSIPLFAGHPAHELLPIEGLRRAAERLWAGGSPTRRFDYGDERGDPALVDFLAERLNHDEDLGISRENLMIIGGSTWGVNMISGMLASAGDVVLVDAPSYRDALHIFRDQRLELCALPIDAEGVIPREMERALERLTAEGRRPKFYYVVPNFQNPTGITLPEARRRAVLSLSRRYGFAIVEDDVYCEIRFGAELPPSCFALDRAADVLRLGTFSKTLAPGLRIGWLVGSPRRISQFTGSGLLKMGGGANPYSAALVAEYCRSGAWEQHVGWLRGQYRRRRDIALDALAASMPADADWTRPQGGYFIWLRLPESLHVAELARRAAERQVYFAPGTGFFVEPAAGARYLRLSFSFLPQADLRRGIEILGALISEMAA